MEWS